MTEKVDTVSIQKKTRIYTIKTVSLTMKINGSHILIWEQFLCGNRGIPRIPMEASSLFKCEIR